MRLIRIFLINEEFLGYGTYYCAADGSKHSGNWKNNILGPETGDAVKLNKSVDLYIGALVKGVPHGSGRMIYGNSQGRNLERYPYDATELDMYEGRFSNGLPHGQGTLSWKNGVQCSGMFDAGKKEGVFECVYPDGVKLWLNYSDDVPQQFSLSSGKEGFKSMKTAGDYLFLGPTTGNSIRLPLSGLGSNYYNGDLVDGVPHGDGFLCEFLRPGASAINKSQFQNGLRVGNIERTVFHQDISFSLYARAKKTVFIGKINEQPSYKYILSRQPLLLVEEYGSDAVTQYTEDISVDRSDVHKRGFRSDRMPFNYYEIGDGRIDKYSFGFRAEGTELEIGDIIEDARAGKVIFDAGHMQIVCDGMANTAKIAQALRDEQFAVNEKLGWSRSRYTRDQLIERGANYDDGPT